MSDIKEVKCFPDVKVKVIIISHDVFGECNLGSEKELNGLVDEGSLAFKKELGESYLKIEKVSGSPADAIISGSISGFTQVFEKAKFAIKNLSPMKRGAKSRSAQKRAAEIGPGMIMVDYAISVAKFEAQLTREDNCDIDVVKYEIGGGKINFELNVIHDVQVKLEVLAKLEATVLSEKISNFCRRN